VTIWLALFFGFAAGLVWGIFLSLWVTVVLERRCVKRRWRRSKPVALRGEWPGP
jgi:hypothetical protein